MWLLSHEVLYCKLSKPNLLLAKWRDKTNWKWQHATNKAPSTLIRFQTKTELFWSRYGYRPHYNAENDHRKRSHLKTFSRVEQFENEAFWKRCFLVWTLKTMLSGNGDVIKIDTTRRKPLDRDYPKWRTDATMWLQFRANFAGQYIEMRMRRVHLTMRTEGITAFSNRYGVVVWTSKNDTKTISVDANLFENGAKQPVFVWKRISVDMA